MANKELREIYAGLAMAALLIGRIEDKDVGRVHPTFADSLVKDAVTFADALIKQLGEE
jgi:hypothetical protein